jgi:hypothetical protein
MLACLLAALNSCSAAINCFVISRCTSTGIRGSCVPWYVRLVPTSDLTNSPMALRPHYGQAQVSWCAREADGRAAWDAGLHRRAALLLHGDVRLVRDVGLQPRPQLLGLAHEPQVKEPDGADVRRVWVLEHRRQLAAAGRMQPASVLARWAPRQCGAHRGRAARDGSLTPWGSQNDARAALASPRRQPHREELVEAAERSGRHEVRVL